MMTSIWYICMKEDIEYTKMNASYQSNRISIFLEEIHITECSPPLEAQK